MADRCYFGPLDDKNDKDIDRILQGSRSIAVVGASDDPNRASYDIMHFLISKGYDVYPVNPNHDAIMGKRCYQSLKDLEVDIDIVDVFRNPKYIGPIVEDTIEIGSKCLWLQLGVVDKNAYEMSSRAGIDTVMNRCIKLEYTRILG